MPSFLDRFRSSITGVLSGFDRLVFRGHLRGLTYLSGLFGYLNSRHVLLKDFVPWAQERTERVKSDFADTAGRMGHEVEYLNCPSMKKEELARRRQRERQIAVGAVASLSCVEPCRTWKIRRDRAAKLLIPANVPGQCLHLYRYLDHRQFGFMHVRLQTWFPFTIQVCMNGREYLRRALERRHITFDMRDNCFAAIADWSRAQKLFDGMLDLNWPDLLDRFADEVFPARRQMLGDLRYQWSAYQSEWATDHAFVSTEALDAIYPALVRHAVTTSDSATVLRFLGRPVTAAGTAYARLQAEVTTRLARRSEGTCVKHHVGKNSVKTYNKQGSVYRAETTINDPSGFKVFRRAQGGGSAKRWRPLRTSVVDLKRRSEISQQVNDRLLAHQATAATDQPLSACIDGVTKQITWHGERHRGLDLLGKDRLLVDLLAEPALAVAGIRNGELRERLAKDPRGKGKTPRQLSGMATRLLRLMRAHGIIKKLPKSRRYQLSERGRNALTAVKAALSAPVAKLIAMAA